jgi:hypothetical protein
MVRKKLIEPSPESVAREKRQRLAREEGVRAMADIEKQDIAVRKNMERLRALRVASEELAANAESNLPRATAKTRKKVIRS